MAQDWKAQFLNDPKELPRSGISAIKKIFGHLEIPDLLPGKDWGDGKAVKQSCLLKLTNAKILEIDKGAKMPELEDDTFKIYIPYAPKDELPDPKSRFAKTIMKSAKDLWKARGQPDKGWLDLIGTDVTLERRPMDWTITEKPTEEGGEKKKVTGSTDAYYFVENLNVVSDPVDIKKYIRDTLVIGKKKSLIKRNLTMDAMAKRHPEYMQAVNDGTFEELMGVKLDENGVYQEAGSVRGVEGVVQEGSVGDESEG